MPASTKASYVGRFAPPGYPNTTSTPSAFRHSINASTARMCARLFSRSSGECAEGATRRRATPAVYQRNSPLLRRIRGVGRGPCRAPLGDVRLRGDRLLGKVELRSTARAESVMELDDVSAAGAL